MFKVMSLDNLKKALNGKKVQDSANPEKLTATLVSLGLKKEGDSSFYLIEGGSIVPVSAQVFKHLGVDEVEAEDLYSCVENATVSYNEGDILTAVKGDAKYTFVYLKEHTDGTLLGLGMCADGLGEDVMRYTKRLCRKATAPERSHFIKICKEAGINIKVVDGHIDTFALRCYGQTYFMILPDFNGRSPQIFEYCEEHDEEDDKCFETGNYFKSKEEALKAWDRLRNGL